MPFFTVRKALWSQEATRSSWPSSWLQECISCRIGCMSSWTMTFSSVWSSQPATWRRSTEITASAYLQLEEVAIAVWSDSPSMRPRCQRHSMFHQRSHRRVIHCLPIARTRAFCFSKSASFTGLGPAVWRRGSSRGHCRLVVCGLSRGTCRMGRFYGIEGRPPGVGGGGARVISGAGDACAVSGGGGSAIEVGGGGGAVGVSVGFGVCDGEAGGEAGAWC